MPFFLWLSLSTSNLIFTYLQLSYSAEWTLLKTLLDECLVVTASLKMVICWKGVEKF